MQPKTIVYDLRFPIGKFDASMYASFGENVETIANLPANVATAVSGLSEEQLNSPYREGGWTLRQTVHHLADSHMNSLCRFKLALTEDMPTIRPYFEDRWAELSDSRLPVDVSLSILDGVHTRWVQLLRNISSGDLQKRMHHPESGEWTLEKMTGLYAWHSRHHTAHITSTRERHNWTI